MARKREEEPPKFDPKDLMAVERSTTALLGTAISLIVLGFVVEKFELFLNVMALQLHRSGSETLPSAFAHVDFYNELGIGIVGVGIALALYTYRYYTRWIRHLEDGRYNTDKAVFFWLALLVASIGTILLASMVLF